MLLYDATQQAAIEIAIAGIVAGRGSAGTATGTAETAAGKGMPVHRRCRYVRTACMVVTCGYEHGAAANVHLDALSNLTKCEIQGSSGQREGPGPGQGQGP